MLFYLINLHLCSISSRNPRYTEGISFFLPLFISKFSFAIAKQEPRKPNIGIPFVKSSDVVSSIEPVVINPSDKYPYYTRFNI